MAFIPSYLYLFTVSITNKLKSLFLSREETKEKKKKKACHCFLDEHISLSRIHIETICRWSPPNLHGHKTKKTSETSFNVDPCSVQIVASTSAIAIQDQKALVGSTKPSPSPTKPNSIWAPTENQSK